MVLLSNKVYHIVAIIMQRFFKTQIWSELSVYKCTHLHSTLELNNYQ